MGMAVRIHVVIDEREREAFRAQAAAEGKSLSEWLREAGRDRLAAVRAPRIRTVEHLDAFFAASDEREHGREPDWDEHLATIERSRTDGLPGT